MIFINKADWLRDTRLGNTIDDYKPFSKPGQAFDRQAAIVRIVFLIIFYYNSRIIHLVLINYR